MAAREQARDEARMKERQAREIKASMKRQQDEAKKAKAQAASVPPEKIENLGLAVGPGLMLFYLLTLFFLSRYRMSRSQHREILLALEALALEVRARGRRALTVRCDVTRDGDLEAPGEVAAGG